MNFKHIYFLLLGFLFASAAPVPDQIKEANLLLDYLLKIDNTRSESEEFLYILNKNREPESHPISRKDFEYNFELFVDYKLKVKYAMDLEMHQSQAFKNEFASFKEELKKPYLLENSLTEGELRKAYSRMQEIVKASHILFKFPPNATKQDTIAVYRMAEKVKKEASDGADFNQLAEKYSDDPSASFNKGDLGYFTALQMVLPFEEAAYNLKVGEISSPILSDFGYHIIKLEARRPNPGQIRVSHLLIKAGPGSAPEEDATAAKKINQIHETLLQDPKKWLNFVNTYSEDPGSQENKGLIPWFGVGAIVPEFELAAFSLKNKGDFSQPVKTKYGYHIIRLEGTKTVPPFSEMLPEIKSKILKDSRSKLIKEQVLARQKAQFNVTENTKLIAELSSLFSAQNNKPISQLFEKLEERNKAGNSILLQSDWKEAGIADLTSFLKKTRPEEDALLSFSFKDLYESFSENTLALWEEEQLYQNNQDYRQLVNEYKYGMLLFELMNNEVWEKALEDSAGQMAYFQKNSNQYMWNRRVKAMVVKAKKENDISALETWLQKQPFHDSLAIELKKKFLEKDALLFTVEQNTYEVDKNALFKELDLSKSFHSIRGKKETVLLVLGEVFPSRPKEYEETKGRLIQDYQKYLEAKLLTELKQKYTIQVNEDEKEKLYQSLVQ
jgi:peptidyl-prolyl cis-trans isomerase SurA